MSPTTKKLRRAYWLEPVRLFFRPSVRMSVTPFVGCKTRELRELGFEILYVA